MSSITFGVEPLTWSLISVQLFLTNFYPTVNISDSYSFCLTNSSKLLIQLLILTQSTDFYIEFWLLRIFKLNKLLLMYPVKHFYYWSLHLKAFPGLIKDVYFHPLRPQPWLTTFYHLSIDSMCMMKCFLLILTLDLTWDLLKPLTCLFFKNYWENPNCPWS